MSHADLLILGGGLVGSALAVAADAHGLTSIVVDPADPAVVTAAGFDGRASAIASAPMNMLRTIGVADRLAGKGCPIEGIRVSDGLEPGALDFVPQEGENALGTMFENRDLRTALLDSAGAAPGVDLRMRTRALSVERDQAGVRATLSDGSEVHASLLIGAEGRNSPTRETAGLNVARWTYDHVALVTSIGHEHSHENVAYEIFYPEGPFAILPLNDDERGHRSAIVWSVRRSQGPGMQKLGDRGYMAELERKMGGFLGAITWLGPRFAHPLGFHHAATITAERLALVGDAAHGIHPIAGKRLGLDVGDRALLTRYERWRSLDTFMVAAATDGLTRLFGIPGKTASAVRRFGLSAVQHAPMLKDRFIAEARGESGALPKLLAGLTV
jgi:2-octaprenyl-6-methoxyphenol hydroxylase